MTLLRSLRRTISNTGPTTYVCRLCETRYERQPLNCRACGSTAIDEA